MKNKKGFTLVELLAVLAVIGILMTIATVSVVNVLNSQKEKLATDTEKKLKDAAISYIQDQKIVLTKCPSDFEPTSVETSNQTCYRYVLVSDIINEGLFTDDAESCDKNAQILVYKEQTDNYSELKAYAAKGICK